MTVHSSDVAGSEEDLLRPGRRGPGGPLLALAAFALGMLGLVFGALPAPGSASGGHGQASAPQGGVVAGSIRVFGAYVREPASPDVAAAYLSIANTGDIADTLVSVSSGASRSVTLHDVPGAASSTPQGQAGSGGMTPSGPLTIPGGTTVTLAPTRGHLMLEGLAGPLRPGDRVSLLLTFRHAGQVLVDAPVIAIADPAPTGQGGTR